jgi:hypothetical protein
MTSSSRLSAAEGAGRVRRSGVLRLPLAALEMARREGPLRMLAQVRTLGLIRILDLLDDARRKRSFVARRARACGFDPARVRASSAAELSAAVHCEPLPAFTLRWALRGLPIDLSERHFVDVGSGWGYALRVAADFPFPRLTGIEFAGELHEAAERSFAAFVERGTLEAGRVRLRNESALEAELPDEPLLILLFNPFGDPVMRDFLDRVDRSYRSNPRPITAVYVNPRQRASFERQHVRHRKLAPASRALLGLLGPNEVRAYEWTGAPPEATRS